MGYDVHITRKQHWSDDEGDEISLQEWLAIIEMDSELRLDGFIETATPNGEKLRFEDPGLAVWLKSDTERDNGNYATFWYADGDIAIKYPDEATVAKMWQLAQRLQAKVQGDDGEEYGSDGIVISDSGTIVNKSNKNPWWKFW